MVGNENLLVKLYPGKIVIPKPVYDEFGLKHVTTGDILLEALGKGYITESQGNTIWASMLAKRRKLGTSSFTTYIQSKQK
jgi:hypothetical protein